MACHYYQEAYTSQPTEFVSSTIGHTPSSDSLEWRQPIGHYPPSFVPQWPAQPLPFDCDMNHHDEAFSGDAEYSPIQDQQWQNYAPMSQWDGDQPLLAIEASPDPLQQIAYDTYDSAEYCSSLPHPPFYSVYWSTPSSTHYNPIYPHNNYAYIPYTHPYAQPYPPSCPEWTDTYPDLVDPPYYGACTGMPPLRNGSISSSSSWDSRESSTTSPEAENPEDEQPLSYPQDEQPFSSAEDEQLLSYPQYEQPIPNPNPVSYYRDSLHEVPFKAEENVRVDNPSLGNIPADVSANLTLSTLGVGHVDSPPLSTPSPVTSFWSPSPSPYIKTEEEEVIETPRRLDPRNPYVCDICSALFIRRHDGLRHRRTHTGETPYVCKGCFEGFKRSDARDRHWGREPSCEVVHVSRIVGTPEGEARERRQMRKRMKAARNATLRVQQRQSSVED